MKIWRASILRFAPSLASSDAGEAIFHSDGLLAVDDTGHIAAVGDYAELIKNYPNTPVTDLSGKIIAPGFVDLHVHYPQVDVIGSPAEGLLPWLENYTFPAEQKFADPAHAAHVASVFFDELERHGVTTALAFATSHPNSVNAAFAEAHKRKLRFITGKVMQDRHTPDGLRDETEQSLLDTEALINTWHEKGRLGYAITPRFAPTSSEAQLRGAGELAAKYPSVWVQSHVSENRDEVAWVKDLFPAARSYLDVYDGYGLLRERAVYAHCIWLDEADRQRMAHSKTAAAISPTSNLFLGSGFFDYELANRAGLPYGLASDVGGGTSFSPFHTMLAAYYAGREGVTKKGLSISPENLWYQHTAGAAKALGLDGVVGNLAVGCEADFIVLDPLATPLLARRTSQAQNLSELLFAMIVLGDDRLVLQTHIASATASR